MMRVASANPVTSVSLDGTDLVITDLRSLTSTRVAVGEPIGELGRPYSVAATTADAFVLLDTSKIVPVELATGRMLPPYVLACCIEEIAVSGDGQMLAARRIEPINKGDIFFFDLGSGSKDPTSVVAFSGGRPIRLRSEKYGFSVIRVNEPVPYSHFLLTLIEGTEVVEEYDIPGNPGFFEPVRFVILEESAEATATPTLAHPTATPTRAEATATPTRVHPTATPTSAATPVGAAGAGCNTSAGAQTLGVPACIAIALLRRRRRTAP